MPVGIPPLPGNTRVRVILGCVEIQQYEAYNVAVLVRPGVRKSAMVLISMNGCVFAQALPLTD